MNWKTFLKGLMAAAINGAAGLATGYAVNWASAATQAVGTSAPAPTISGKGLGVLAGAGAIIGVVNYLKQSPLQPVPTPGK